MAKTVPVFNGADFNCQHDDCDGTVSVRAGERVGSAFECSTCGGWHILGRDEEWGGDGCGQVERGGPGPNLAELRAEVERLQQLIEAGSGAHQIATERQRHFVEERWTEDHDDEHSKGELAQAAELYVFAYTHPEAARAVPDEWPWDPEWWKPESKPGNPSDRDLVKAGALIAAELDRRARFRDRVSQAVNGDRADLARLGLELLKDGRDTDLKMVLEAAIPPDPRLGRFCMTHSMAANRCPDDELECKTVADHELPF